MLRESRHRRHAGKRARRVLLLSQWFDPEPTFKGLLFARALRERGFEVQVLTGFPNYPGGRVYDGYRIRLFQREVVDGIQILRVPLYPSHDNSGGRRALNYMSFAISAATSMLFIRRPDVAYVYHPPATIGLAARAMKALRGVPYVYDIQDLWPDSLEATNMVNRSSILHAVGLTTQWIYKGASRIVVLSEGFRERLVTRGVPAGKIDVIPNWTYEGADQIPPKAERVSDRVVVVYAGNMGAAQGLDTVLDAAMILRDEPVLFRLVGEGVDRERLRARANRLGLGNVEFVDRQPTSAMPEIFGSADALMVHLKDDPLFSITVPSKTQAYLMAGRPILMGVRGDAARLVSEAGAGYVFEPESPNDLARVVRELASSSAEDRARRGAAGRAYYWQHLSLRAGADRFARVLEDVALLRPRSLALKRALDVGISSLALLVCALPMAVIALVLRAGGRGPVLFTQERPGKDGAPFRMMKFRTMTDDRDASGGLLPDKDRLTAAGRWLRASSVSELPEFWNVLKGDMSLVGPRPLLMRYTAYFTDHERLRLRVRPGVTGLAQVSGRNTASWDERLALDVFYVKNFSLRLDFQILGRTVRAVFGAHGVVVDPESTMQDFDDERKARLS